MADRTPEAPDAREVAQQHDALRVLALVPLRREGGPLYGQLTRLLRAPIETGALPPGSPLPRSKPLEFQSLSAIAATTVDRRLVITSWRKERSALASEVFGLPAGTACYCLRALLRVKDETITQTAFYFPPAIGSRLKRADFDDVVVFRAVQRHLGITLSRAQIKVRAEVADETLAQVLDYEIGGPILATEMLYFNAAGDAVELTVSRNRADRFSITYDAPNDMP